MGKDPERLESWIGMAADHWRKYQPKRNKSLLRSGSLAKELRTAAQMTADQLDWLGAYDGDQTNFEMKWHQVRELYLLPREEPEAY